MRTIFFPIIFFVLLSCRNSDEIIRNKSPFAEILILTPRDGRVAIVRRAEQFASKNNMHAKHSFEHFSENEYFVIVTNNSMNIAAENVMRGEHTVVRGYSRDKPTKTQKEVFRQYLCGVLQHGCATKLGLR